MQTYTILRELADSWVLLVMFIGFITVVLWTLRPGSQNTHEDASDIPMRNDQLPISESVEKKKLDDENMSQEESSR